jgi:simple sugar transport system substrate-binding protein
MVLTSLAVAAFSASGALAADTKLGVVVKIGGIPWFNSMEAGNGLRSSALKPT